MLSSDLLTDSMKQIGDAYETRCFALWYVEQHSKKVMSVRSSGSSSRQFLVCDACKCGQSFFGDSEVRAIFKDEERCSA